MANNEQKALERIFDGFSRKKMLLFIGQADKNNGLRKLLEMPWRIIFTTRFKSTELKTSASFEDLMDILSGKIKILDHQSDKIDLEYDINVIKISSVDLEDDYNDDYDQKELFSDSYKDILKSYMRKNNDLVIYGFDYRSDGEADKGSGLCKLIYKISKDAECIGNVTFLDSVLADKDKNILSSKLSNVTICEMPFEDMLERYGYSDVKGYFRDEENDSELADTDFFYSSGKMVRINRNDLLGKPTEMELLTENFIYKTVPRGKLALKNKFWKFMLPRRFTFPEWYGYFAKSRFYIERNTDKKLYDIVSKALEKADDTPIILSGAPCSGKTAAIGELAYRIFEERKNPVVFIRAGKEKPDARSFNDFLVKLKNTAEEEQPVLIIWDSSAINQGKMTAIDSARELRHELSGIYGRRFVLLCTAYQYSNEPDDETDAAEKNNGSEEYRKSIRSVNLKRSLGGEEKNDFLKKLGNNLRSYDALENRVINSIIKKYEDQDKADISMLFYDLSTKFESILSEGLRLEQSVMADYICEKLDKLSPRVSGSSLSEKQIALLRSFMASNKDDEDEEPEKEQKNKDESYKEQKKKLNDFNLCIALFGQVDMKAPAVLARSFYPEIDPYGVEYIPWIDHGYLEDSYEDYFCFRNNFEAAKFIENHFEGEENSPKKYDTVFGMIKSMICCFHEDEEARSSFFVKKSIIDLLRCYGPNKDNANRHHPYYSYKLTPTKFDDLTALIKPLSELLNDSFDKDGAFTIIYANFCHEFFNAIAEDVGKGEDQISDEEAEKQIELYPEYMKLIQNVITGCQNAVGRVKDEIGNTTSSRYGRYLKAERNSLVTEMVICDSQLKLIRHRYFKFCGSKGKEPDSRFDDLSTLNFGYIYDVMKSIIESDPTNEYYYISLLRSFKAYAETSDEDNADILGYTVWVGDLIDRGEENIPSSFGSGRFQNKVLEFRSYEKRIELGLDDIEKLEKGQEADGGDNERLAVFRKYYEKNKLSVILYACRNEMKNPGGIDRVFNLLNREDLLQIFKRDHYANEFRFRVAWEHFTGSKFNLFDECQCIALTNDQWEFIRNICSDYYECTAKYYDGSRPKKESIVSRNPSILLAYALSDFYCRANDPNVYQDTGRFIEKNIRDEMFYNTYVRMRTPFMICGSLKESGDPVNGTPKIYSGVVSSDPADNKDSDTGKVVIDRINLECRCHSRNIGGASLPKRGTVLKDIELGLGYMGFSVYNKKGRENQKKRSEQKKGKGR